MLLAVTDVSRYTRLMEEIFSALINCIFIFGAHMKVYSGFVDLSFKAALFDAWPDERKNELFTAVLMFFMLWLILFCKASGLGRGKRWAVAIAGQRPTAARGNRGGMQIQVRRRPLTEGRRLLVRSKTFTLDVAASDSVASVKAQIHEKEGIPPEEQRLVFRGKLLKDERTLQDYCVFKDAELELLGRVPGGMKATGGAPSQPSPAGTPSDVAQVSSERAPRPQADPEQATPVPTEAEIKEKITRIVQDYKDAIQEANEAVGREPTALGQQVDKIRRVVYNIKNAVQEANAALGRESTGALGEQIDGLIVDLGINLAPSRAAHAAGAGANAARKDLVPSAPSGRPGKGAGKGTEKLVDASEPTASGTAGTEVGERSPAVSEPPKSGAAEPEVDEKKSAAEEVPDDEKIDTSTRNFTLICKVWRSKKKKMETVTK